MLPVHLTLILSCQVGSAYTRHLTSCWFLDFLSYSSSSPEFETSKPRTSPSPWLPGHSSQLPRRLTVQIACTQPCELCQKIHQRLHVAPRTWYSHRPQDTTLSRPWSSDSPGSSRVIVASHPGVQWVFYESVFINKVRSEAFQKISIWLYKNYYVTVLILTRKTKRL